MTTGKPINKTINVICSRGRFLSAVLKETHNRHIFFNELNFYSCLEIFLNRILEQIRGIKK